MDKEIVCQVLKPYLGTYVTAAVTVTDEIARTIFEDTAEGVLEPASPAGYMICGDRKTFFMPEAVFNIEASGRIIIHLERR